MNWIKHDGNEMPCKPHDKIAIKQRNGHIDKSEARNFMWRHRLGFDGKPWDGDIIAWRLAEQ